MLAPVTRTAFRAVLEQLESHPQQYFGTAWARCHPLWTRERLYGSVMRVAARTPAGDVMLYAKTFKPRNDRPEELDRQRLYLATEFERTRQAREAFAAMPHAGVARPVACFPDLLALVTEEAPGIGLDALLKRLALTRTRAARDAAVTALQRVGEWIRVFQRAVPANPERKDYRRYLERRLRFLVRQQAIGDDDMRGILDFFDEQFALIRDEELVPVATHADLCPTNILVAPDRVTILDLAASLDRAKYLDVAHLYMHLALASERLCLGRRLTAHLQQSLLEAFEAGLHPDAPLFRLMLLQNVTVHCMVLLEPQAGALAQLFRIGRLRRARAWALQLAGVAA